MDLGGLGLSTYELKAIRKGNEHPGYCHLSNVAHFAFSLKYM